VSGIAAVGQRPARFTDQAAAVAADEAERETGQ
jgi:hypothetical protein